MYVLMYFKVHNSVWINRRKKYLQKTLPTRKGKFLKITGKNIQTKIK